MKKGKIVSIFFQSWVPYWKWSVGRRIRSHDNLEMKSAHSSPCLWCQPNQCSKSCTLVCSTCTGWSSRYSKRLERHTTPSRESLAGQFQGNRTSWQLRVLLSKSQSLTCGNLSLGTFQRQQESKRNHVICSPLTGNPEMSWRHLCRFCLVFGSCDMMSALDGVTGAQKIEWVL
jgi:hypothetical protein